MNKKILFWIFAFIIATITIASAVNAWMPEEHVTMNRKALESVPNAPLSLKIKGYEDYFHLCDMLTDISVVAYSLEETSQYVATHDQSACLNSLPKATTNEERACGYGICAHHSQDTVAHNELVPRIILKTKLPNGLIHSIEEFYSANRFSNAQDLATSRKVLSKIDISNPSEDKIIKYLEKTFGTDPRIKDNIEQLVVTYIEEVRPSTTYDIQFENFFRFPTWIYIVVALLFLISITLLALMIKRLINGVTNITTIFTGVFALSLFALSCLIIYGLVAYKLYLLWKSISMFLFSPIMYAIGGAIILIAIAISIMYSKSGKKMENIGTIPVALFMLIIGIWLLTFPTALDLGGDINENLHNKGVENTISLLEGGRIIISNFDAPSGKDSIPEAERQVAWVWIVSISVLLILLGSILYLTFRKQKRRR